MNEQAQEQPRKKQMPLGKRFEKGKSGNPGGRPKGVNLTKIIADLLAKPAGDMGISNAELLCQAFIIQASKGNGALVREIFARIDGPVLQRVMVEDNGLLDVIKNIAGGIPPARPKTQKPEGVKREPKVDSEVQVDPPLKPMEEDDDEE